MKNNKRKLKIVCIIHSLGLGGMERVMAILLNSFAQRKGVEVSLLLIGRDRNVSFELVDNIQVYQPDFTFNPQQRNLSTMKTMRFIRKRVKEINPDTILSFGEYWNNLVLLSLYGLKYPVYVSDRSQPNKNLGKVQNLMRNKLYPTASGYIAQTEKAAEIAQKNQWNKNIAIIGNPITQVSEDKTVEKENIILTVGRLIPTKHIDELMEMFKTINDKDWKLIVVGGNAKNLHLLEDYQQRVKKWNLEDRIHLVGAQTNVADYYKKAKIFAFTSSSEGFPNVVGEAMAFGLPVIAYDCVAGPSDLIEDGKTGFLIEERNQERYIKNLKRLMSDAGLRKTLGENGKEKTMAFDADKIANKFFNFITK